MTCAFTPCRCRERMGNEFYFMPIDRCLYESDITPLPVEHDVTPVAIETLSVRENFCTLGHDCLCDQFKEGPDPNCRHYRRNPHEHDQPCKTEAA
jgi:hypothetical protein